MLEGEDQQRRIVGIVLVRNEDVFVERAIRNISDFCDHIIVADNFSKDQTWEIVTLLVKDLVNIERHRIRKPSESHDLIKDYAGTHTWIFGVDGDEIYDPTGLREFRKDILAGRFDDWWVIFGNVLNCVSLDPRAGTATGHLAPPSRSMTKLYNFGLISAWRGPCIERLHGGTPVFKAGYDGSYRLNIHEKTAWEESKFRCLHTCFLRRSSMDRKQTRERPNIMEKSARGLGLRARLGFLRIPNTNTSTSWKRQKYLRGDEVTKDVTCFFCDQP